MTKPKVHPTASKNIDAYLSKASEEQRPILELIRKTILGVDHRIQEDWKWNAPCFYLEGLICWYVGFKQHVGINFYKGSIIKDTFKEFVEDQGTDKGNRLIHYNTLADVNVEALNDYVQQAIGLNENKINVDHEKKKALETPDYFLKALVDHPSAKKVFEEFTDAQRRDYIEWLIEAKRESTRDKRMAQAVEWITEGKVRNWKYMK